VEILLVELGKDMFNHTFCAQSASPWLDTCWKS